MEILNGLSPEQLIQVADSLSAAALLGLIPRGQSRLNAFQGHSVPVGAPAKGYGKDAPRQSRKGDREDFGKGKGKSGKGGKAPIPIPPPLDRPEELPAVANSSEQVAFQVNTGTPWQLLGPTGGAFRWDLVDRDAVAEVEKREIRDILGEYAEQNGIPLRSGVKLALRRGQFWVSYAGGISNVPP